MIVCPRERVSTNQSIVSKLSTRQLFYENRRGPWEPSGPTRQRGGPVALSQGRAPSKMASPRAQGYGNILWSPGGYVSTPPPASPSVYERACEDHFLLSQIGVSGPQRLFKFAPLQVRENPAPARQASIIPRPFMIVLGSRRVEPGAV